MNYIFSIVTMLKVNFVFYIYVLLEKLYRNTDRSVRKMISDTNYYVVTLLMRPPYFSVRV